MLVIRTFLPAAVVAPAAILYFSSPLSAQTERRTLSGDAVAIYNIAGRLRVESGSGSAVTVEITRGGRDARELRVEQGTIGDREALRVIYPSDRVVYPELERGSGLQNVIEMFRRKHRSKEHMRRNVQSE